MSAPALQMSQADRPLFSVVTITYNDLEGLRRTAASVLGQVEQDFEWVVIDGGSRDGTLEYLRELNHPGFKFQSGPDRGIYDAMNKGVEAASGEYLIFMNGGDAFYSPDELRNAAADVESRPDLLYGDALEVEGELTHYKKARDSRFYWYSMFTHHQAIYYRSAIFGGLRYDESLRLAADWALTVEAVRRSRTVKYVARPVCRFSRGGASFDPKMRALAEKEAYRVYRDYAKLRPPALWLVYLVKTSVNDIRRRFPALYDRLRMSRAKFASHLRKTSK